MPFSPANLSGGSCAATDRAEAASSAATSSRRCP
jgi:hypothetical protein